MEIAMSIRETWLRKTDSEVVAAFKQLDQYTAETQDVIKAEYERRSSQPHSRVAPTSSSASSNAGVKEGSVRETSLRAARDHLASLTIGPSATGSDSETPGSRRHESSSGARQAFDHVTSEITRGYEYKVVPFIGQSRGSLSASDVAQQLESAIAQQSSAGWEFWQLSDVNVEVQPGCIAGLFGASVHYVRFDQLIFRKGRLT
jgi:hypothetical protein